MKPGTTVILRNAKIDMFKGSMRLAVDKWGRIEVTEPATFTVKEDNNLSLVEYELVTVAAEEWWKYSRSQQSDAYVVYEFKSVMVMLFRPTAWGAIKI